MFYAYYPIIAIFFAAALGWTSWITVVSKLSPFMSGALALAFFYSSLFVALSGTFTLLLYYLRAAFGKKTDGSASLHASLRQGSLLSLMSCTGLVFQRLRVLTWWDALLLLSIILLVEYLFTGRE